MITLSKDVPENWWSTEKNSCQTLARKYFLVQKINC